MPLRFVLSAVRGEFAAAIEKINEPIAAAATGAIKGAADQVKSQGRANIASAGFSAKWQNALRIEVYPKSGASIGAALFVHHKIPYSGIFERGATISGKPLLWIPLPGTPARTGGRRLTPRVFSQTVGPLTSIKSRTGKPILAAPITGRPSSKVTIARLRRGQRASSGATSAAIQLQPIFIGVPRVTIRARFNLQQVFDKAASGLAAGYLNNLKT